MAYERRRFDTVTKFLIFPKHLGFKNMPRHPSYPILYNQVKTLNIACVKGFLRSAGNNSQCIVLQYDYKGKQVVYRVNVTSVASNLGKGRVWYFICPSTGKRCRKLYFIKGKYYHREAFRGCMYEIQTQSKRWRQLTPLMDVEFGTGKFDVRRKYFKRSYRGKPTKRYLWLIDKATKILKGKSHVVRGFTNLPFDQPFE